MKEGQHPYFCALESKTCREVFEYLCNWPCTGGHKAGRGTIGYQIGSDLLKMLGGYIEANGGILYPRGLVGAKDKIAIVGNKEYVAVEILKIYQMLNAAQGSIRERTIKNREAILKALKETWDKDDLQRELKIRGDAICGYLDKLSKVGLYNVTQCTINYDLLKKIIEYHNKNYEKFLVNLKTTLRRDISERKYIMDENLGSKIKYEHENVKSILLAIAAKPKKGFGYKQIKLQLCANPILNNIEKIFGSVEEFYRLAKKAEETEKK